MVFLKNVVKFFFSRLRNFCFAVYFYLFVKFSGLFLPATLTRTRTRTRDLYPRHLGILASAGVCSSQSLSELSAMAESTRVKAERKLICIMSPFEDQAPL